MEEVLPPQTESGAGFEPPRVRQFTVFMENKVGRLQQLVRSLEEADVTIAALSVQSQSDTALVRMICADRDSGRDILQREDFSFTEQDVLVVEMPTRSKHPLTAVCAAVLAAEINIHYTYPMMVRPDGPAVVLYVDDHTLAAQLFIRKQFTLIGESDLQK